MLWKINGMSGSAKTPEVRIQYKIVGSPSTAFETVMGRRPSSLQ